MLIFLGIYAIIGMIISLIGIFVLGQSYGSFSNFVHSLELESPDIVKIYNNSPKSMEFIFWLLITFGWPWFLFRSKKS